MLSLQAAFVVVAHFPHSCIVIDFDLQTWTISRKKACMAEKPVFNLPADFFNTIWGFSSPACYN
jgi:hypothetical protein